MPCAGEFKAHDDLLIRNNCPLLIFLGLLQMSVKDVGQALLTLKLGKYVQSFQEQQIDGAVLAHLNDEGLQQLGMNEQLHRSILLGFVSKKAIGLDTN